MKVKAVIIAWAVILAFNITTQARNTQQLTPLFTENKGPVHDQNNLSLTDVLYSGHSGYVQFQ